jgi:hypothetical protein
MEVEQTSISFFRNAESETIELVLKQKGFESSAKNGESHV